MPPRLQCTVLWWYVHRNRHVLLQAARRWQRNGGDQSGRILMAVCDAQVQGSLLGLEPKVSKLTHRVLREMNLPFLEYKVSFLVTAITECSKAVHSWNGSGNNIFVP